MGLICSWNVNSIKARLTHLVDYLKEHSPDVILLQELKCINEAFPYMEIEDLGYNIVIHGQKTYNGVAILSKTRLEEVHKTLDGDDDDLQARFIEAYTTIGKHYVKVISVYVPNGQDINSDKFQYKLKFLDRLYAYLKKHRDSRDIIIIGGDFNIAPEDLDVYDPKAFKDEVCFHPEEKKRWRLFQSLGYYDAYRLKYPHNKEFSWWDYRAGSWNFNKGMRIDHFLINPPACDVLKDSRINPKPRSLEKPSDHAPCLLLLTN